MIPPATTAVGVALVLDLAFGEYPERLHPVAWFGHLVGALDRAWSHPRLVGAALAVGLPLGAAGAVGGVTALSTLAGSVVGAAVAGLALFAATSLRMLRSTAADVIERTEADLDGARESARALVGRDTAALSAADLRSAAVESAAENLVDGLVAPLSAFAIGAQLSLSVGAGAAAWVKAVNTLDSMLGYRSRPLGWASARLDDAVMWLPARLGAVLLALAAVDPGALVRGARWARAPSSPNSGWPMATLAAALDARLEKPGAYVLNPGGEPPSMQSARRGVRVVWVAGLLAFLGTGVVSWS